MERLIIYDAHHLDCSPLYQLGNDYPQLVVGEREHSLTAQTADETATIIAVFTGSRIDKAALRRMPHLRLIACLSTGTNNVDLAECAARGITVCNVPTYGEHTVAEYTFALILSLIRRIPESAERLRAGRADHIDLVGTDLDDKTLAVIGTGHIGRNVIRIAKAFRMNVIAVDTYPDKAAAHELGFTYVGLHDALRQADVITLHVPAVPGESALINKKTLALLKPTAILINTSRGELVNTTALLHALHTQRLAGAGLDVIEGEAYLGAQAEAHMLSDGTVKPAIVRDIAEHEALLKLPNVILTNHNAFNTTEAKDRIIKTSLANIQAFLGDKPQNTVKAPKK